MVTIRAMIFALAAAGAASAQEIDVEAGKNLFLNSCWQCHGLDAKGFGPMAEMLAIETTDLTELSKRNGGVFPTEAVAMQIDGRSPLLAHGGEMPIFGPSLEFRSKHYAAHEKRPAAHDRCAAGKFDRLL